jgi:hypothetical protein
MPARLFAVRQAIKASLFAALALSSLAAAGCSFSSSGPVKVDPKAFSWTGDLAAPGTLFVRDMKGTISVVPSPDNAVHVTAATRWTRGDPSKDVQFVVTPAANAVTVCAVWNNGDCSAGRYTDTKRRRGLSFSWGTKSDASVEFTIEVPAGVRVDALMLQGDVNVRAAGPVRARTVSGNLKIGTAVGPVDAETVNGNVDVRMTTVGASETGAVRAVTKNGDAVAWVPQVTDGRLEASTLNGEIGTDFAEIPSDRVNHIRKFSTSIGAGTREYVVQTLNGSAWLRLINADGTVGAKGAEGAVSSPAAAAQKAAKPGVSKKRNQ